MSRVRCNARLWAFVILPRVKVHAYVYLIYLLDRPKP
jgi:hypothetical protein